jgi:hypothetical protein
VTQTVERVGVPQVVQARLAPVTLVEDALHAPEEDGVAGAQREERRDSP